MNTAINGIYLLRITNMILSAVIVVVLVYRGRVFYARFDRVQKWRYVSFILFVLACAVFSLTTFTETTPIGILSAIFLAANITTLYAIQHEQLYQGYDNDEKEQDTPQ